MERHSASLEVFPGSQNIESRELFHLYYIIFVDKRNFRDRNVCYSHFFNIHVCRRIGSSIMSLTYLLTPWSRVTLEKIAGFQLVNKFPAFYRTPRFITTFRNVCYLYLSLARSIQLIPSIPLPEAPS